MRHLKLAFRTLARTPFVTAVAILSLALGIGANAAIYSLFNEMLRAPLPVPHPEQLVTFGGNDPSPGSHQTELAGGNSKWVFSYPMLRDLEAHPGPFSGIAGHAGFEANVAFRGTTLNVDGEFVSGSYFPVLGVRAAAGRLLSVEDDKVIGGQPVAVLSHRFWQTQLNSDPDVVGRTILANGKPLTVVGVAQAGFDGTVLGSEPAIFVPLTIRTELNPWFNDFTNRRRYWVYLFGRLSPGVTMAQAQQRINVFYHNVVNSVEVPLQKDVSPTVLSRFKTKTLLLVDGRRGASDLHQDTQMPLELLFGITGFVLLIACANIANLLLARAANRSTEMAVRLSLGATRKQLVGQLLTESVLLALIGGLVGIVVAWGTLHAMMVLLPVDISSTLSFALSGPAIAFTALLSLATGVAFGLFPALHSTRPDLVSALRDGSGKTSSTRSAARFRSSLVVTQIALSMALLVPAGLFIRSLDNVSRVKLGVDVDSLVTFSVSPALNGFAGPASQQLYANIERDVGAIPGVVGVAAARMPLIANSNWDNDVNVEGFPHGPDTDLDAYYNAISPGYFRLMGETLVSGREFTGSDVFGSTRVAVVNEAFAKKFHLGAGAVGKMMGESRDSLTHLIIGVVKDAKYSDVKQKDYPVYFLPYKQDTTVGDLNFYVRTALPPAVLMPRIRAAVRRLEPNLPIVGLKTMSQQIRDNVYLDRMISMLSAGFAILATLLAAIGLYGVLAYSVLQRTREIGVRMALGADSTTILGMILRHVAFMTAGGALIGAAAAWAIGRGAQSLLFGVNGRDPAVMVGAAIVLAVVALAAGALPARKAARLDPVSALRYE